MKYSTFLLYLSLSFSSCYLNYATADALEKSKLTAERNITNLNTNTTTFYDNVVYSHANMTINAEQLIRSGDNRSLVTINGNPVKVKHINPEGVVTEVFAKGITYNEESGIIDAKGQVTLIQNSKNDQLTLKGSVLKANRGATQGQGFGFVLSGSPTEFNLQQPGKAPILATANQLRSNGKGKKTELLGNVKLRQGTSSMAAAHLTYDGAKQTISAQQGVDGEQQVETEFFWEKDEADNSEDKQEQ